MSATLIMRETTAGLGGAATTTEVSSTAMNNIFDDVGHAGALAGETNYRAVDIYNSGDAAAVSVTIYMSIPTTSIDTLLNLGVEAAHLNSNTGVGAEDIAPPAVSFEYHDSGSALPLDNIPAGEYARVWIERIVSPAAGNIANDLGTISYSYA